MNIMDAFPGSFIKAADLKGRRVQVTIDRVEMQDLQDQTKAVLYFRDKDRGLVLNKTNANLLCEILGSHEVDDWTGKQVVVYPTKTEYQGRRVDCIRIDSTEQQRATSANDEEDIF